MNVGEVAQESEEDGFDEVPIFGATGEEPGQPEIGAFDFVNVERGEITQARGGDVEAQTIRP